MGMGLGLGDCVPGCGVDEGGASGEYIAGCTWCGEAAVGVVVADAGTG